jgi:hypothetical protein
LRPKERSQGERGLRQFGSWHGPGSAPRSGRFGGGRADPRAGVRLLKLVLEPAEPYAGPAMKVPPYDEYRLGSDVSWPDVLAEPPNGGDRLQAGPDAFPIWQANLIHIVPDLLESEDT